MCVFALCGWSWEGLSVARVGVVAGMSFAQNAVQDIAMLGMAMGRLDNTDNTRRDGYQGESPFDEELAPHRGAVHGVSVDR